MSGPPLRRVKANRGPILPYFPLYLYSEVVSGSLFGEALGVFKRAGRGRPPLWGGGGEGRASFHQSVTEAPKGSDSVLEKERKQHNGGRRRD